MSTAGTFDAAVSVSTAVTRIMRTLRQHTSPGTLSLSSTSALALLHWQGPMRLRDLAAAERVSAPTMSRIITTLQEQGLVERTADPDDGRAFLLSPTETGRTLVAGATTRRAQLIDEALQRLDPDDRANAVASIERLSAALADISSAEQQRKN